MIIFNDILFKGYVHVFVKYIFTVCSYIFIPFLLEKYLCHSWNVYIKFPCALLVYLCLSSEDLFNFSIRASYLYLYFLCFKYFHKFDWFCSYVNVIDILFCLISSFVSSLTLFFLSLCLLIILSMVFVLNPFIAVSFMVISSYNFLLLKEA